MSIPVFKPLIENEELEAVRRATAEAWFGSGKYVGLFEQRIRDLVGGERRCVAVNTGTSALHVALCLAGVGPGDEVILPSFNFCGVAQAVVWTGATPVFCDIRDDTMCLDSVALDALVTPRSKAVISIDYASNFADHEEIAQICRSRGLRHIHDAAHSFLWKTGGKSMGSYSDICTFSFDPVKVFTCIDAGVVVVSRDDEDTSAAALRMLGQQWDREILYKNERPPSHDVPNVGFRYHLSNVHAALGLAQLDKAGVIAETRRRAFNAMADAFGDLPGVRAPTLVTSDVVPFIFVVRVRDGLREKFRQGLSDLGIDTSVHWQPIHTFSFFDHCRSSSLATTELVGSQVLTLPLHSKMSDEDLDKIISSVAKLAHEYSR